MRSSTVSLNQAREKATLTQDKLPSETGTAAERDEDSSERNQRASKLPLALAEPFSGRWFFSQTGIIIARHHHVPIAADRAIPQSPCGVKPFAILKQRDFFRFIGPGVAVKQMKGFFER